MACIFPLLPQPIYYRLECMYFAEGQNAIPLLLRTNVHLEELAKNPDLFLKFVQWNLSDYVDFANYLSDRLIYCVQDMVRGENEEVEAFLERVTKTLSQQNPDVFTGYFEISINRNHPSSLNSFTRLNDEQVAGALFFAAPENKINILLGEQAAIA